jgi:hypothetical protein
VAAILHDAKWGDSPSASAEGELRARARAIARRVKKLNLLGPAFEG